MPKLIGMLGAKQHGKDTIAKFVMEADSSFVRVAFADAVRDIAYAIDPYIQTIDVSMKEYVRLRNLVDWHGWDTVKQIPDVRRLLQRIGTEGVRDNIDSDVWVNLAFAKKIKPALAGGNSVIITDVRFKNEIQRVWAEGGQLWCVQRPSAEDGNDPHVSELDWRDTVPDRIIMNDGSLDKLRQSVLDALG